MSSASGGAEHSFGARPACRHFGWRVVSHLPFYGYGEVLPVVLGLLAVIPWRRLRPIGAARCATLVIAGLAPFLTGICAVTAIITSVCVLLLLAAVVWHWRRAGGSPDSGCEAAMTNGVCFQVVYNRMAYRPALRRAWRVSAGVECRGRELRLTAGCWNTHPKIIGDVLRILVFWGGCHVSSTVCRAILSSRRGGASGDVLADG